MSRMSGISHFSSPEFARARQGLSQDMSAGTSNAGIGLGVSNPSQNNSSELDGEQWQDT